MQSPTTWKETNGSTSKISRLIWSVRKTKHYSNVNYEINNNGIKNEGYTNRCSNLHGFLVENNCNEKLSTA